jgi:hypothetical protein
MALDSLAAIASLVLAPLGMGPDSMPGALKPAQAHYHYDYDGPILRLVRVEKLKITSPSCKPWADALVSSPEKQWQPDPASTQPLETAWEPWASNDREPIDKCDDFPCKVKFDEKEVSQMKRSPEKGRLAKFYELVRTRALNYLSTGLRPHYESSDAPADLWAKMDVIGFKSALPRPSAPFLLIRKLNFDPDQMLTLHMILDRRVAEQTTGDLVEAAVWVRDAYIDHYFDGWSEASLLICDPKEQEVFVVQMVMTEMDLLKNRGFFAHALFPKYRGAFESNAKPYLDREFTRIEHFVDPTRE